MELTDRKASEPVVDVEKQHRKQVLRRHRDEKLAATAAAVPDIDGLVEMGMKEGYSDIDFKTISDRGDHWQGELERLRDRLQVSYRNEPEPEGETEVFGRDMPTPVRSYEASEQDERRIVNVKVDVSKLSEKNRKTVEDATDLDGADFVADLWADKNTIVVVYGRSKDHPRRLRLVDPENKREVYLTVAEWERMITPLRPGQSSEGIFPAQRYDAAGKALPLTEDDRAEWLLRLRELRVDGDRLGSGRVYFPSDEDFPKEMIVAVNEVVRKK